MSDAPLKAERPLNISEIKRYALDCSVKNRAGVFERVGEEFLIEVAADVEDWVRKLRGDRPTLHPVVFEANEEDCPQFVTGELLDKVKAELNGMIARMIQNKVQRHPSCGKTLKRTR